MLLESILGLGMIFGAKILDKQLFGGSSSSDNEGGTLKKTGQFIEKLGDQMAESAIKSGNSDCMEAAQKYFEAKAHRGELASNSLDDDYYDDF